ncbi:MAG: hypothetical protein PVI86_18270 [Phycisphaerae bacterium]|jgi:hypothetical protein
MICKRATIGRIGKAVASVGLLTFTTALSATAATPLGMTIMYQGRLDTGGAPASGDYDMQFSLWNAASGGSTVGSTLFCGAETITVVDGLFTAELDFGAGAFDGDAVWLEMRVRPATGNCNGCGGQCPYTTLSPRQPVTAAPYALYALNAPEGSGHWSPYGDHIFSNNPGNVGIGTSDPQTLLEVRRVGLGEGQLRVFGSSDNGGELQLKSLFSGSGAGNWGRLLFLDNENNTDAWVTYGKGIAGNPALQVGTTAGYMQIDGVTGNLGIGTTTPSARLHVTSDSGRPAYITSTHPTTGLSALRVDMVSSSTGGASIAGVNSGGGRAGFFQISNPSNSADAMEGTTEGSGDGVYGRSASGAGVRGVSNNAVNYGGVFGSLDTPGKGLLVFGQTHLTSSVAIGTTSIPSGVLLNVDGITRTGVLEIMGADVAEKFPVSELDAVRPGTVMEIDPDSAGKLRIARGAYNRRVAGVVSGAGDVPVGAVLGHLPGHEEAPPIALSGRVWVSCDTNESAINVGDLLTTSGTPGYAMAVREFDQSQGAIIGKAMTALPQGETGLVLVLVSLQ